MRTFIAQISDEDFDNADAVTQADILRSEIVKCKDCKWRRICMENNIRAEYVTDDDYCSWGERK